MKSVYLGILLFVLFFVPRLSFGQKTSTPNLEVVRKMLAQNKHKQAHSLLQSYTKQYPKDPYVYWLYAHSSKALGLKKLSHKSYEKAMLLDTGNRELRMDYGRTLFKDGRYIRANDIFEGFLKAGVSDSLYYEAMMMKGYAAYSWGDINQARVLMKEVLTVDPTLDYLKDVVNDLDNLSKPYLKLNGSYMVDDQPLTVIKGGLEAGVVTGLYFNPKLNITTYNFDVDEPFSTFSANVSNMFLLGKAGTKLNVALGLYQNSQEGKSLFFWGMALDQRLMNSLSANVFVERSPYLGTRYSAVHTIQQDVYGVGLDFDNKRNFAGNVKYSYNQYTDDNHMTSFSGWMLLDVISVGSFKTKIGYNFSFSNAKYMRYEPSENGETVNISDEVTEVQIPGVYSPYYTPSDEIIHAVIGDMKLGIGKSFNLYGKATYGFMAENNVPYLFSVVNENNGEVYEMATYRAKYHPYTFSFGMEKSFSKAFVLNLNYQLQKTAYYKQDNANLSLYFKL